MKFIKLLFKFIFRSILAVIAIIVLTLCSFWVEIHSSITLPQPTGQYDVGRTTFHWVDTSRVDSLSPPPYSKRELIVLSVDSKNQLLESYLKRKLNYRKVDHQPSQPGEIYLLPVKMIKQL